MGVDAGRRANIEGNLSRWRRAGAADLGQPPTADLAVLHGVPGLSTEEDVRLLSALARSAAPGRALEVGRFCGYTTALLALCGLQVTSIDSNLSRAELGRLAPWHVPVLDEFRPGWQTLADCVQLTIERAGIPSAALRLVCGDSRDPAVWPAEQDYALAFVDGGHDAQTAFNDLNHAWWRLRPGGVLVLHDYELALRQDPASGVDLALDWWMARQAAPFNGPFAWGGSSIVWMRKPHV